MEQLPALPPAALHVLIALWEGDRHGYAIMQDVAERTGGKVKLSPGTLYGSIKRMLELGLIEEVRQNEIEKGGERRRYYRATALGRKAAQAEVTRITEVLEQAKSHGLVPQIG
ncbi:MAG: PadR family transcriptional regulator [Bryobacteraceae bacterium]